ncbi:hypothetical protein D3C71_1713890 [compost metagenome]
MFARIDHVGAEGDRLLAIRLRVQLVRVHLGHFCRLQVRRELQGDALHRLAVFQPGGDRRSQHRFAGQGHRRMALRVTHALLCR